MLERMASQLVDIVQGCLPCTQNQIPPRVKAAGNRNVRTKVKIRHAPHSVDIVLVCVCVPRNVENVLENACVS
eukprot:1143879-Amphidinium_carterae.1